MKKKIFFLSLLGIFSLTIIGYAQEASTKADAEFKEHLTKRNVSNLSILIPSYLTGKEKDVILEKYKTIGNIFSDDTKTKVIQVLIDKESIPEEVRKLVSNKYKFHEKAFHPGINLSYIAWNKAMKAGYSKIEKFEDVDFGNFHGFVIKGKKTYQDYLNNNQLRYIHEFLLFEKEEDETLITIIIGSQNDYFLSDEECNYIASSISEDKIPSVKEQFRPQY